MAFQSSKGDSFTKKFKEIDVCLKVDFKAENLIYPEDKGFTINEKLVNLFLCKIVDETNNPEELKFYWKGIAYDDQFSLIDRLQKLHQDGMQRFLGEDVVYTSDLSGPGAFLGFRFGWF